MSDELFNLVFSGELVKGSEVETVKANLVKMLKLSPGNVEKMFSGKTITIKKNIDTDTGRKLRAKFKQAGVIVRLESFSDTAMPSSSSNSSSDNTKEESTAPSKYSDATQQKSHVKISAKKPVNPGKAVFNLPEDPVDESEDEEENGSTESVETADVEEQATSESEVTVDDIEEYSAPEAASNSPHRAVFQLPDDPVDEPDEQQETTSSGEEETADVEEQVTSETEVASADDIKEQAVSDLPSEARQRAVFQLPDDPVENPEDQQETSSTETDESADLIENQTDSIKSDAPQRSVFDLPEEATGSSAEEPSAAPSTLEEAGNKIVVQDEPAHTSSLGNEVSQDKALEEMSTSSESPDNNKEAGDSNDAFSLAPVGADVLEGYEPPESPPPPNVDGITIAAPGVDLLEKKKVVKPVEVDISGISLADE